MAKHKSVAVFNRQQPVGKRGRVQSWLISEGLQVGELQGPGAAWILQATDNLGRPIVIAQPSQQSDKLDIQAAVNVDEPHRKALESLEEDERKLFLSTLRFNLLGIGVDYAELGEGLDKPHQFRIRLPIYDDGLTKDEFLQRFSKVARAMYLVQIAFGGRFTDPPPQNKAGFYVN